MPCAYLCKKNMTDFKELSATVRSGARGQRENTYFTVFFPLTWLLTYTHTNIPNCIDTEGGMWKRYSQLSQSLFIRVEWLSAHTHTHTELSTRIIDVGIMEHVAQGMRGFVFKPEWTDKSWLRGSFNKFSCFKTAEESVCECPWKSSSIGAKRRPWMLKKYHSYPSSKMDIFAPTPLKTQMHFIPHRSWNGVVYWL